MAPSTVTGAKRFEPKKFEPKHPVKLDPPKDTPISVKQLALHDGQHEGYPAYVAIKGMVFDVGKNPVYGPGGKYKVFAGKDASRALGKSSLKESDCSPQWEDLGETEKTVLDEWYIFFSRRYNIVGKVSL